jgi:ADP-ribosylglycohydrolase
MSRAKKKLPVLNEPKVEQCEIEGARRLVTIGPDDPIWEAGSVEPYRGAIVRIVPAAAMTDEKVDSLRLRIAQVAAATRVLPRRHAGVVTEAPRAPERSAHKRAREIVGQMVDEANTNDREALRAFCEEVMGRAGL